MDGIFQINDNQVVETAHHFFITICAVSGSGGMEAYMDKELLKVLAAREQRWEMRRSIVEKQQNCLITITLCVPLLYRTDEEFGILFLKLCNNFYKTLVFKGHQVCFENCIQGDDGPAVFISTETEAKEIKKICVEAEESIIGGRILDIDVMDRDGSPVGRGDIGLPPRKCFICENPAAICVSRRLHSANEISKCVMQLKKLIESNNEQFNKSPLPLIKDVYEEKDGISDDNQVKM
ncbi:citrate lyase holo-[acyl-carrier protein] synthase [Lutispora sp.]|uniref:citrate lyase holo-[acyl-carrier protein] synthase n=1 Tax=Lutispora sp. TaxID=2828727 RepID=UPI002B1FE49E|nr:citrate lyase holo-[acyl-carrier protein] synthase [Lutispora sp.]MEA4960753.1 citrate lyase holo-[acyl-carrier protein] synthase [Lutispora sp.]